MLALIIYQLDYQFCSWVKHLNNCWMDFYSVWSKRSLPQKCQILKLVIFHQLGRTKDTFDRWTILKSGSIEFDGWETHILNGYPTIIAVDITFLWHNPRPYYSLCIISVWDTVMKQAGTDSLDVCRSAKKKQLIWQVVFLSGSKNGILFSGLVGLQPQAY